MFPDILKTVQISCYKKVYQTSDSLAFIFHEGREKGECIYRKRRRGRRRRGLKNKEEESKFTCTDMSVMSFEERPYLLEVGCHRNAPGCSWTFVAD